MNNYYTIFSNETDRVDVDVRSLEKLFAKCTEILAQEKVFERFGQGGNISVIMVDNELISQYNSQYRKKEGPTDVISLSYLEGREKEGGFPGENLAGEIIISLEMAEKQAKEYGLTFQQELEFLFVHGVLHIFGFDHEDEADRRVMFALHDRILERSDWRKGHGE